MALEYPEAVWVQGIIQGPENEVLMVLPGVPQPTTPLNAWELPGVLAAPDNADLASTHVESTFRLQLGLSVGVEAVRFYMAETYRGANAVATGGGKLLCATYVTPVKALFNVRPIANRYNTARWVPVEEVAAIADPRRPLSSGELSKEYMLSPLRSYVTEVYAGKVNSGKSQ
jgi:hypothetical protein